MGGNLHVVGEIGICSAWSCHDVSSRVIPGCRNLLMISNVPLAGRYGFALFLAPVLAALAALEAPLAFDFLELFLPFLAFPFLPFVILRGSGLNSSRMLLSKMEVSSMVGSAFFAASRVSFASLSRPVFMYKRPSAFSARALSGFNSIAFL